MKKYLPLLFTTVALTGYELVYLPFLKEVSVRPINVKQDDTASKTPAGKTGQSNSHLVSNHWSDVSKIRDEAARPSYQVNQGKTIKAQATQYLNRFCIQPVGYNPVDDSMYGVYLRPAVDSQCGEVPTSQFKLYIQNTLRGWQQRWKNMTSKPSNPAFANSLMEVMSMTPL